MKRVLYWFRRDLRVTDNTALWHACAAADEIIPVYLLSIWKKHHPWTGPNRQEFLCGCLESLARNLQALGGRLILRAGDPVHDLGRLVHETHAEAIFFNRGTDPFSSEIQKQLESDYWELTSEAEIVEPGEKAARRRLSGFLNRSLSVYRDTRDFPAKRATSRVAQDSRVGALSPREVFCRCLERSRDAVGSARRGIVSYLNELIWREFYMQILANFPRVLKSNFSDDFPGLNWDNNESGFRRWSEGSTGFPIVEADQAASLYGIMVERQAGEMSLEWNTAVYFAPADACEEVKNWL